MATKVRIEFLTAGFAGVLADAGTVSLLNSVAARKRSELEQRYGGTYQTKQSTAWDGRPRVIVSKKPTYERVSGLTHEQWMSEIWPKVGGAKWRPKH